LGAFCSATRKGADCRGALGSHCDPCLRGRETDGWGQEQCCSCPFPAAPCHRWCPVLRATPSLFSHRGAHLPAFTDTANVSLQPTRRLRHGGTVLFAAHLQRGVCAVRCQSSQHRIDALHFSTGGDADVDLGRRGSGLDVGPAPAAREPRVQVVSSKVFPTFLQGRRDRLALPGT
jgi:hypothetical protein